MPIKKSFFESKWYYRVLKVILLVLPLIFLLVLVLKQKVLLCAIKPGVFTDLPLRPFLLLALGLILYYLFVKAVWRLALYMMYGGLEDDTKREGGQPAQPGKKVILFAILALAAIAIYAASRFGYIALPESWTGGGVLRSSPKSNCPATSAQTSTPCGTSGGGIGVSGVIVRDSCNCPSDTRFSGTKDVITPGGPYKICTCF
jgi:hypothetical protein